MSYTDSLTGLKNRNAYIEELEKLEKSKCCIGIIFADINGLKNINDNFGHKKGDSLISASAEALKSVFDDGNSSFYRIGCDEFVVFCKEKSEKEF